MISAEEIKALKRELDICKREYQHPDAEVDLGELFHLVCKFEDITSTLQTLLNQAAEVLKKCDEAMGYMSEYDIPICLPDDVKQALAAIEPYITSGDIK